MGVDPLLATVERSRTLRSESLLSRPLLASLTINWELAAYAILMLVAISTRFWDLGSRAIHHDESLHALYAWKLYHGEGYVHDPMMHGPFQFEGVALIYLLFGASDYTARILAALFGIGVVIAPYFLRREMGRLAAVVAAALFALSPTFLYFSRFAREAAYVPGWEALIVVALFAYLRDRKRSSLVLFSLGVILLYATKETVFITGAIFFAFFVVEALVSRLRRRPAAGWSALRSISARNWGLMAGIFLVIYVVMYTTFFTNPKGIESGTWGALKYWFDQHEVQRGGQPFFYYFMLLPLYEFLPLAAALGALVFLAVKRQLLRMNLFTAFMVFWFLGSLAIYSWAGEKMPWLALHLAEPLVFLGAMAIAGLVRRANRDMFLSQPGLLAAAGAAMIATAVLGGLVSAQSMSGTQLGVQSATLQKFAIVLIIVAALVGMVIIGRRHGARVVLVPTGMALVLALLVLSVRTAWGVTYARGDIPQDMLVYVQSSPDVPRVVREIERLSYVTGTGKDMKILLDGGYSDASGSHESIAWPLEWYLRDYKGKSYYSKTLPNPTDAPVILAMVANEDPIKGSVGNYVAQRERLNWWYPEDYKSLTLEKVWDGLRDPSTRNKLWRYFLYRETLNTLGSRDFDFFVRSDLAKGVPVQVVPVAPPPVAEVPITDAAAQTAAGGITIFGKTASGGSVLGEPRDVAVGPAGLLYVVDQAASKVVAFRPDGTVAQQWGKKGSGDGEFNEPWGIAVAPNGDIYVADTWNHRIEKFDKDGKFVTKWGSFADTKGQLDAQPGAFWGPRDVAVAPNGNVLVTDTGNKRVQVFDAGGQFVKMFGGDGTEPGKLKEPTGIATDRSGNIYVADTWNRRIQKLDSEGRPLAQFPVAGWDTQSVVNKPYLMVDQEGRIYYTEPEKHRFVVLSAAGVQEGVKGSQGSDPSSFNTPTGIAVTPAGEVYIGDGRNGRVIKYPSWR